MLELRETPDQDKPGWQAIMAERLAVHRMLNQYDDADLARERAVESIAKMSARSTLGEVVDGDRAVGFACWGLDRGDLGVFDVRLDDPARVGDLLPALTRLGREQDCRRLAIGGWPHDETRSRLAVLPGFVTVATNMELWLDAPVADPSPLQLRAMAQEEFDAFMATMVTSYADELAAAGMSAEAALEQSRTQTEELLPEGLASPLAHFFTAVVDDVPVGTLWLSTERPMAFVYDVVVAEDQRRKGYGEAIMNAGARWCQARDIFALGLNVFGHNPGARALYDKLGYVVTEEYRALDLADAD